MAAGIAALREIEALMTQRMGSLGYADQAQPMSPTMAIPPPNSGSKRARLCSGANGQRTPYHDNPLPSRYDSHRYAATALPPSIGARQRPPLR